MRVAEIVCDYRKIQQRISQIRASPSAEEYTEVGFVLLRGCENDARALLGQSFASTDDEGRDEEEVKLQLRRCVESILRSNNGNKLTHLQHHHRCFPAATQGPTKSATHVCSAALDSGASLCVARTQADSCPCWCIESDHSGLTWGSCFAFRIVSTLLLTNALQEMQAITDASVEAGLRNADVQSGKWIEEDPPFALIQRMLAA